MATSVDYIEFVCEQISELGSIRYKKMFGEYMVYLNDKPIFLVCQNTVYIKKLPDLECLMSSSEVGIPYKSAKEHYILDIENKDITLEATLILEKIIPVPKPRKKKEKVQ